MAPTTLAPTILDIILNKPPWGIYDAAYWDSATKTLSDIRGGNIASGTGNFTSGVASGNGASASIPFIGGGTQTKLVFPTKKFDNFTVCSITRYSGPNKKRILTTPIKKNHPNPNWLHGHWEGKRGCVHYDEFKTNTDSIGNQTDWLVMCGTNGNSTPNNVLADGVAVGTKIGGGNVELEISINTRGEESDWEFSYLMIWDQVLSENEMKIVSNAMQNYLSGKALGPTRSVPTTLRPTTLVPTTLAPTTLAPTTLAPTTLAPTTLRPTTLAPTTLAPTTLAPTTLAPTTLRPTIHIEGVNFNNIVAWFDPNTIVIDTNKNVISWPSKYNSDISLNSTNQVTLIDYKDNSNIKMVSFNTNTSYLSNHPSINAGTTTSIQGFVCLLCPMHNNNKDLSYLLSRKDPFTDNSFRWPRVYDGYIDTNDFHLKDSIRVNGISIQNYDNTDKYVILSVKLKEKFDNITIGSTVNSRGFKGYIGDFICLKPGYTDNDVIGLEKFLINKWDLKITPAPTTLVPTTLAPTTLRPTTLAPTTLAPTTLAPTTLRPTTLAPTTLVPTTLAPTTLAPTTLAPTTLAPTTLTPTTLAPTTLAPTTLAPTTLAPTTLAPTTLRPTTLRPTTLAPTTLAPTTLRPTIHVEGVNLNNIVAWFDPNYIVIDMSNNVTSWPSIHNSEYKPLNAPTENLSVQKVTLTNGPIITNKMVFFNSNQSYLSNYSSGKTTPIGGFVCVLYPMENSSAWENSSYLLYKNNPIVNNDEGPSFRWARKLDYTIRDDKDAFESIHIDGIRRDVYSKNGYDNKDKYVILSVKLKADQPFDNVSLGINDKKSRKSFMGYIGDFICLKPGYTDNDRMGLENFVNQKWNLNKSFPRLTYMTLAPTTTMNVEGVNLDNIVAWFDPNYIVIDMSNNVTSWPSKHNSQDNPLNSIDKVTFKKDLKMVSFDTNVSYMTNYSYHSMNNSLIGGFVCLLYPMENASDYSTSSHLLSKRGPARDEQCFRWAKSSYPAHLENNDAFESIHIDGIRKDGSNYNNTNKYVILSVKLKADQPFDGVTLGCNFRGRSFKGYIGDFICLKPGYTDNDRMGLENFVNQKWNLNKSFPRLTLAPTTLVPTRPTVNLDNIVAWFDPNSILIDTNKNVISWPSKYNSQENVLDITENVTLKDYENNANIKMVSFDTNRSYMTNHFSGNTTSIGGFVCLLYPMDNESEWENSSYLLSKMGPDEDDRCFRWARINYYEFRDDNDSYESIHINGIKQDIDRPYFHDDNVMYDNTNKYIILSVKLSETFDTVTLGCNFSGRSFKGYLGDFICLKPGYTDNDRIGLENFVMQKWNPYFPKNNIPINNFPTPWGIYDAINWDPTKNKLRELSDPRKDVIGTGNFTSGVASGNGASASIPYIGGGIQTTLVWPEIDTQNGYTICSIARYSGNAQTRILSATDIDWYHGHNAGPKIGVAKYSNTLNTNNANNVAIPITNWLVMCGTTGNSTPNNILANGESVGTSVGGVGNSSNKLIMSINKNTYNRTSDWQFSYLMIWDQVLSEDEMRIVSQAMLKYLNPNATLAPTTLAPTTLAPTTLRPTTLAPTTLAPTTLAPTTLRPTTLAPTTLRPTTLAPTTLAPTTLAPTNPPIHYLYGIGANSSGQLGNGTRTNATELVPMTMPTNDANVTQIATGTNFTIVLMTNGSIYSCGRMNPDVTTMQTTLQAMRMPPGRTAKYIAAGHTHMVALMDNGTLYYCGPTMFSIPLVGNPSGHYINTLTAIQMNNFTASAVSCGSEHIIVLMNDGSLYGLGRNSTGQLGNDSDYTNNTFNNESKMIMPSGTTVKKIVSNYKCTIVLMTNGTIYGCGLNDNGQLGIGNTSTKKTLQPMNMNTLKAKDVVGDNKTTVVLMDNNKIYYCGSDSKRTQLTEITIDNSLSNKTVTLSSYMIYYNSVSNEHLYYYTNYTSTSAIKKIENFNFKPIDIPLISSSSDNSHTVVLIRQ